MLTPLIAILLQAASPAAEGPQPIPPLPETTERIAARDAQMFWGFFEGCDPDAVADVVHPDYRMLHDLAGMPGSSGAQMVEQARRMCAARAPGGSQEGYKNRRLLVPGSRRVQMLGQWGALEEGHHTFHEWRGEELGWVMTGGARYIHTWQWMAEEGRYRLLESLSLDHAPAPPYPPEQEDAD